MDMARPCLYRSPASPRQDTLSDTMITTIKQMTFVKALFGERLNLLESHVKGRFLFMRSRVHARFSAYLGFSPEPAPMIKDIEQKKARGKPKAKAKAALTPRFNYNLERMQSAVDAPAVVMPKGLTREQKMRFLMGDDE